MIDPDATSFVSNRDQVSKAAYTPFDGMRIKGRLDRVFLRGQEIVTSGSLIRKTRGNVVIRGI